MSLEYLDFDLVIERYGDREGGRSGGRYRARVLSSPAGQASVVFTLPFTDQDLEILFLRIGQPRRAVRRQVRLGADSAGRATVQEFGGKLYQAVFDDEMRALLRSSLDAAAERDKGLRLRLRLTDAPELSDLPWEYLYNPSLNRFLSLSSATPLVRYLELPERIRPLAVAPPLRILVMISDPTDVVTLDVGQEWDRLHLALGDLERQGLLVLDRLEQATLPALQAQLRCAEYHIFHYIGHGAYDAHAEDGVLLLEDEQGRGRPVRGSDLGVILHDARTLRLAVLNACEGARTSASDPFAGTAQSLVQQGVPAVIAMQFEITDEAAITFAHGFYAALVDSYPVDAALAEARKAIFGQGNELEWGTPVLYMRAPDGVIFSVAPQPAARLAPEERPIAPPAAIAGPEPRPSAPPAKRPTDAARQEALAPESAPRDAARPAGRMRPRAQPSPPQPGPVPRQRVPVAVLGAAAALALLLMLAFLVPGVRRLGSSILGRDAPGPTLVPAALLSGPAPSAVGQPTVPATLPPTSVPAAAPAASASPAATVSAPAKAAPTAASTPTVAPTPLPLVQRVQWKGALPGGEPGIVIEGASQPVPWSVLEGELARELLPQLTDAPQNSTLRLAALNGQANMVLRVVSPGGQSLGDLWFGWDPYHDWAYDGLVRFGSPAAPLKVKDIMQRHADGTYHRVPPSFGAISFCANKLDTQRNNPCPGSVARLPSKTAYFALSWPFNNVPYGASFERIWTRNGQLISELHKNDTWDFDWQNSGGYVNTFCSKPGGWPDGAYRVELYINGQLLQTGAVQIGN